MLEIILHGLYIGAPYEVGAAGALIVWGGEELVRFHESYRRSDIRSSLGAELRILSTALEWAHEHGGMGETVLVRTALGSLASACQGRGLDRDPDLRPLIDSLEQKAWDFEGVHAEISPAWVTAPAQEAALRSLIGLLESPAWLPATAPLSSASRGEAGPPEMKRPPESAGAPAKAPEAGAR